MPLSREPPKLLGKTGSATDGLRASIKSYLTYRNLSWQVNGDHGDQSSQFDTNLHTAAKINMIYSIRAMLRRCLRRSPLDFRTAIYYFGAVYKPTVTSLK